MFKAVEVSLLFGLGVLSAGTELQAAVPGGAGCMQGCCGKRCWGIWSSLCGASPQQCYEWIRLNLMQKGNLLKEHN